MHERCLITCIMSKNNYSQKMTYLSIVSAWSFAPVPCANGFDECYNLMEQRSLWSCSSSLLSAQVSMRFLLHDLHLKSTKIMIFWLFMTLSFHIELGITHANTVAKFSDLGNCFLVIHQYFLVCIHSVLRSWRFGSPSNRHSVIHGNMSPKSGNFISFHICAIPDLCKLCWF